MEALVKLFLPLESWALQKALGPVLTPDEWQRIALSFVPPPDSLVNRIKTEWSDLDSPVLLSPSLRRRIRNLYKSTGLTLKK